MVEALRWLSSSFAAAVPAVYMQCIYSPTMDTDRIMLGLLEEAPRYGYELKQVYDERFGRERQINAGQVYRVLARLERDGLVSVVAVETGAGPERKRYALTVQGVADFGSWLDTPIEPELHVQTTLFAKVVLALLTGRHPQSVLDAQRATHLGRMRALTRAKREGDLTDRLLADHALFHVEADLRWIEVTSERLGELRADL